jgi:hypothetical protein
MLKCSLARNAEDHRGSRSVGWPRFLNATKLHQRQRPRVNTFLTLVAAISSVAALHGQSQVLGETHLHKESKPATGEPAPFGFDFSRGWRDPYYHSHFTATGIPRIHLFRLEPAFLDRDLFIDFSRLRSGKEEEFEVGVELEWAFNQRIGLVLEVPYVFSKGANGREEGFGDIAVAPRVMLAKFERFSLALNFEAAFPTGNEERGLGSGEVTIAPSLSAWVDLGGRLTASFQSGYEHGLESGGDDLFYRFALMWALQGPDLGIHFGDHQHHSHSHAHYYPPGMISLTAEFDGRTPLNGPDEGISTGECIFGLTYSVTDNFDVRAGYIVPVMEPKYLRNGWIFGVVYHF